MQKGKGRLPAQTRALLIASNFMDETYGLKKVFVPTVLAPDPSDIQNIYFFEPLWQL
jgi:hypothetical protein